MESLSLRVRVFLFFAFLAFSCIAVVLLGLFFGYRQLGNPEAFSAFLTGGLVSCFGILAVAAWIWMLFDENVAKAVDKLATEMRARAHADVEADLDRGTARYLGDLAPAAAAVTTNLSEMKNSMAETVMRETTLVASEKARLTSVLRDLPTGVVLCNAHHQMVLYNGRARGILERVGGCGLDRSVLPALEGAPIEAAYAQLQSKEPEACADLRLDLPDGKGRIAMGMRLLQSTGDAEIAPGYVLTMRDAAAADLAGDGHTVVPRETVFDFDLLHAQPSHDVTDQKLTDLKFVIFDTETTGLMPDRGDEVCQIAAMRVVKGKLVREETLDTLVNPARPIPLSSTNIHGITDAMVKDAPDFPTAAKAFHDFADGAVLVAHNAPFDMAFFYRRQAELGLRFDHPVLDTVLLSAVLYGQTEQHSLDAISDRLGVVIPEEDRHTAMGDTIATTEVFLKFLAMLESRGVETFGEVLSETKKHRRLLEDLNG